MGVCGWDLLEVRVGLGLVIGVRVLVGACFGFGNGVRVRIGVRG